MTEEFFSLDLGASSSLQKLVQELLEYLTSSTFTAPEFPYPLNQVWQRFLQSEWLAQLEKLLHQGRQKGWYSSVLAEVLLRNLVSRLGSWDPSPQDWLGLLHSPHPLLQPEDFWEIQEGGKFPSLYLRQLGRQIFSLFSALSLTERTHPPFCSPYFSAEEVQDMILTKGRKWESLIPTERLYLSEEPLLFEKRYLEGELLSYATTSYTFSQGQRFVFVLPCWQELESSFFSLSTLLPFPWLEGTGKYSTLVLFFWAFLIRGLEQVAPESEYFFPESLRQEVEVALSFTPLSLEQCQWYTSPPPRGNVLYFHLHPRGKWPLEFSLQRWQKEEKRLLVYFIHLRRRVLNVLTSQQQGRSPS